VFLFVASLYFYTWGEPKFVLLMLFSILVNYVAGRLIEFYDGRQRIRKTVLVVATVYNVGALVFFKYINFIIDNVNQIFQMNISPIDIMLPIGISFYTFQIMSYTFDVYKKTVKSDKSYINLGTYLCMFPQLVAGPIVVYNQVSKKLQKRSYELSNIEAGMKVFILGLASKVQIWVRPMYKNKD